MANEIENKSSLKLKTCETLIDPFVDEDGDNGAFEFVPDTGNSVVGTRREGKLT